MGQDDAKAAADAGPSSGLADFVETYDASPDFEAMQGDKDQVIDDSSPEEKGSEEKKEDAQEQEKKGEGAEKDKPAPFHEHPDWQRMMKERDEAIERAARAEGALDATKGGKQGASGNSQDQPDIPYKDISKMTKEDLREWIEDDPLGYSANLYAQIRHELKTEMRTEGEKAKTQDGVKATYASMEEKYPDFQNMWKSGTITKYINQHPGHNAISAYHELTAERKLQEAEKRGEEKAMKNIKAKRSANVIGSGPERSSTPPETDKVLQNTRVRGGLNAVLAEKLLARRRGI